MLAAVDASGEDPAAALRRARELAAEDTAAADGDGRARSGLVPDGRADPDPLQHRRAGVGGLRHGVRRVAAAHRAGRLAHLWVDETRPLLQGARLTAWEAARHGMPHSVLPDAAAALIAAGEVDLVLVGADRVAADGSVANKVGTYGLAVLAHHGVPFVVVAPVSTIDPATPDGAAIVVEQRAAARSRRAPGPPRAAGGDGVEPGVRRDAAGLVTALVTDGGVIGAGERGVARCVRSSGRDIRGSLVEPATTMQRMKGRVLVVDDDTALAEMLGIVLRGEGFEPVVRRRRRQGAGRRSASTKPDLVLLDLMLPGQDGIEVCRAIRAESGVPIVMLTAKSDTVDVVLGLESGADDYIVKPFKPKELVARVRARLRRSDEPAPETLQIGDLEIDVAGHSVQARRRADLADAAGVRPAGRAGPQAVAGVHPRGAARAGLGLPARRGHPAGERPRPAAALEDRAATPSTRRSS